jgi:hypothetical protein
MLVRGFDLDLGVLGLELIEVERGGEEGGKECRCSNVLILVLVRGEGLVRCLLLRRVSGEKRRTIVLFFVSLTYTYPSSSSSAKEPR